MLTAAQMKAARALVGMEQKALAVASGVSLPTIQRMEASNGIVRGVIDTLVKILTALEAAGVEFIDEGAPSPGGGRGIRLRRPLVIIPRPAYSSARDRKIQQPHVGMIDRPRSTGDRRARAAKVIS